ncbi:hypothetical protein [Actinomadura coerulea]|uniref:hypothetical protein n=1 Tax=Actinomadura coerulea TaxID=46159 RepID=UPI0016768484
MAPEGDQLVEITRMVAADGTQVVVDAHLELVGEHLGRVRRGQDHFDDGRAHFVQLRRGFGENTIHIRVVSAPPDSAPHADPGPRQARFQTDGAARGGDHLEHRGGVGHVPGDRCGGA